jgi:hypothetical protein
MLQKFMPKKAKILGGHVLQPRENTKLQGSAVEVNDVAEMGREKVVNEFER